MSTTYPPTPAAAPAEYAPLGVRLATLAAIVLPVLGVVAAAFFLWGWGFTWTDFGVLVGMYLLTALGITVGFHRLFVHRSFETYLPVKVVFAVLGSMAVQGPLLTWVAVHRRHHQHSDTPDDPHTPHHQGRGVLGWLKGYWHSHIGWFFGPEPAGLDHYIKDIRQSRTLRVVSALFPLWVALGLALPAVLGGVVTLSWRGVWTGLVWGGLVRVFLVHHVTWSVNSACHLWGLRPFASDDRSRNNVVFGVLALGEGWHNAHHAFPTSARHGLSWWQPDVSYWVIRGLALVGLAWNLKLPSRAAKAAKRRNKSPAPPVALEDHPMPADPVPAKRPDADPAPPEHVQSPGGGTRPGPPEKNPGPREGTFSDPDFRRPPETAGPEAR